MEEEMINIILSILWIAAIGYAIYARRKIARIKRANWILTRIAE